MCSTGACALPLGSCHSSACTQAATLCTQVSATPAPIVDAPVLQRHALGLVVSPSLLWMQPFLFCLFVPSACACRSEVTVTSSPHHVCVDSRYLIHYCVAYRAQFGRVGDSRWGWVLQIKFPCHTTQRLSLKTTQRSLPDVTGSEAHTLTGPFSIITRHFSLHKLCLSRSDIGK